MWLPTKLYESLPALYVAIGSLLLVGGIYIGLGHGLRPVYLSLGSSCVIAGICVACIRYNARSLVEPHSA